MQPVRCMVWNSGRGLDLSGELTLKAQGKGGERKRELVEAAIEVGRQPGERNSLTVWEETLFHEDRGSSGQGLIKAPFQHGRSCSTLEYSWGAPKERGDGRSESLETECGWTQNSGKGRCRWIEMRGRIWGSICLVICIFSVKARVEGNVFGRFGVRATVRKAHGKALCEGKLEFISLEMFPFFYLPIINSNK